MAKSKSRKTKKQGYGWLVKVAEKLLERPRIVLTVGGALVIAGLASWFWLLPREGFPPTSTPLVLVQTTAGGFTAEQVDEWVISPLVDEVNNSLDSIDTIDVTSFDNGAFGLISLSGDIDAAEATEQVRQIAAGLEFPENVLLDANTLDASKINGRYSIALMAVNPELEFIELYQEAVRISGQLEELDAVEAVEVERHVAADEAGELQQVGYARFGTENSEEGVMTETAALIGVITNGDIDAIDLSNVINEKIAEINANEDTQLVIAYDLAPVIEDQISSLFNNMAGGLLAVAAVTLLFIAFRASLLSALFIATVIIITLFILYLIGYTINTMSLFALVLALGLFVDDATIVTEAAERAVRSGEKTRVDKAAIRRIAMASMAGTLTTVLVFLPLAFLPGILGDFIRVMPVTIAIALFVSLLLSLFVLPISFKYVFSRKENRWVVTRTLSNLIDKLADFLAEQYTQLKKRSLRGYVTAIGAILISFVFINLGFMKFGQLPFNIFPETKDGNDIQLSITYPPGTSIDQAVGITEEVDELTAEVLGIEQEEIAYFEGNERSALAFITLSPYYTRNVSSQDLADQLNDAYSDVTGAVVQAKAQSVGPPADDYPFKVQIYSEDPAPAVTLAEDIVEFINGKTVERPSGQEALITDARIDSPTSVLRTDSRRFTQVEASFDASDVSALTIAAQELVEGEFPEAVISSYGLAEDSVEFDFGFESENQDSFAGLLLALPLALLAMYALLSIQFKSLLQPLLIFLAIPFSIFGVAYSLDLSGYGVSFFTMFGFLALIGIVVNNTILLVDYANQERRKGYDAVCAISNATKLRLRPLMTTAFTTMAALTPLAISDPFWQPLALTIMFGLLSSTILVVVAFPFYYLAAYWVVGHLSPRKILARFK